MKKLKKSINHCILAAHTIFHTLSLPFSTIRWMIFEANIKPFTFKLTIFDSRWLIDQMLPLISLTSTIQIIIDLIEPHKHGSFSTENISFGFPCANWIISNYFYLSQKLLLFYDLYMKSQRWFLLYSSS